MRIINEFVLWNDNLLFIKDFNFLGLRKNYFREKPSIMVMFHTDKIPILAVFALKLDLQRIIAEFAIEYAYIIKHILWQIFQLNNFVSHVMCRKCLLPDSDTSICFLNSAKIAWK